MTFEEDILSLIPQRSPFVMIDKLIYADEKFSRSVLKVREGNIFVKKGELAEPGLVENIAQTAAAGIGYICRIEKQPVRVGYIGAIQNLEIAALPKINDEIETEVVVKNQIFNVTIISGRIRCNDKLLAQCEMKIFISNKS
jgi:predicted hotdog family 3-hydroxylacyl-ACP dehydratase